MSQHLDFTIEAKVPIKAHFSKYSNGAMIHLTQVNKLGYFVLAEIENPEADKDLRVFNIEMKFGDRCDEWTMALCRGIAEKLGIPKLIIIISLTTRDPETYNLVLQNIG